MASSYISPPPTYGRSEEEEARITPWVATYPAETFREHARLALLPWELQQWGVVAGGADFVLQCGTDRFVVTIARIPRCSCSSYASPCGHVFWAYTRILGVEDNDPLVYQTSLTARELAAVLASVHPVKPPPPPPAPPIPPLDRKRSLSTTTFDHEIVPRRPAPATREQQLPRPPPPQNRAPPPPQQPPPPPASKTAYTPPPPVDMSLIPAPALRDYLTHFVKANPTLVTARTFDLYRPGPLEAVSDIGCYTILADLLQRDPYVRETLQNVFGRAAPPPPPPVEQHPTTSLPTPPPTANPFPVPSVDDHALSFGKEVNRVRQSIKWTASKRGSQVRKNFDNIVEGVSRSVTRTSHPQTKLNAVRSLIQMGDLAIHAEGGEIRDKLINSQGIGGIYTVVSGIWDALSVMNQDGQRRALPDLRKFAIEVLRPYGLDVAINGAVDQIEKGEDVSRHAAMSLARQMQSR